MILQWIKKHSTLLITSLVCIVLVFYCYACESKVRSLTNRNHLVNRQELQFELARFISLAEIRILDLDQQDELRAIFLQNGLLLLQGQPLNPVGIVTAIAAVFGLLKGGQQIKQGVKNAAAKRNTKTKSS